MPQGSSFRSVLADRQTTDVFGLVLVLCYLGHDLVKITPHKTSRSSTFEVLCPSEDFKIYKEDYFAGRLALSDARAFCDTSSRIGTLIRDARRLGGWTNPDFREMLADEAAGRNFDDEA
jgi:hypothetical protein